MPRVDQYDPTTGESDEQTRDCEHCGRSRPLDTRRYVMTVQDYTDGAADYERSLLCRACWNHARETLRKWSEGEPYL